MLNGLFQCFCFCFLVFFFFFSTPVLFIPKSGLENEYTFSEMKTKYKTRLWIIQNNFSLYPSIQLKWNKKKEKKGKTKREREREREEVKTLAFPKEWEEKGWMETVLRIWWSDAKGELFYTHLLINLFFFLNFSCRVLVTRFSFCH